MKMKIVYSVIAPLLMVALLSCHSQKRLERKKHSYMEAAYVELKTAINEAEVTILNDTVKILFPEHLLFKKNQSEISQENYPLMERFAKTLNKYGQTSILINGYTDKTGGEDLNEKLSQNRADTARNILKYYNVAFERMHTWGLGVRNPIAENSSEEGRRKNRRVEFIILYSYDSKK